MNSSESVSVMDASAILAYMQKERGLDVIESVFDAGHCWISTVNTCEVLAILHEDGMPIDKAQYAFDKLGLIAKDFDSELARLAAELRVKTRSIGASLGDRACLALAQHAVQMGFTPIVYTAEQAWTKIKWPFKVVVIRSAKA